MNAARAKEWAEAQRRCRLSDVALAMAKELGLAPKSLVKNIPNRSEPWKAPVEDWVVRLHQKKFGNRRASLPPATTTPSPFPTPPPPASPAPAPWSQIATPPPDPPPHIVNEIDAARDALFARLADGELDEDSLLDEVDRVERETPVSRGEIDEDNTRNLRRRDNFRRFADLFAAAAAKLDFVQRIVLFGSVAAPLKKEISRHGRLRRARVEIWHECKDVDLAIWVSDLTRLKELKRVVSDTTNAWQVIAAQENLPGIPHHQVDVFIMEPGTDRYRGNLCHFGQCPKGKPECLVAGCGAQPFLRLYADFDFDPRAPFGPHAVVLYAREAGFDAVPF
jgi:hypothetical protein